GYAAYTFAIGALAFWTPAFLERTRGIPKAQATVQFGAIVVVTGFVGTYAGGWIGDYFLRVSRQAYLWVSGGVTLVAAPLTLVALAAPQPAVYWTAIVAAELCLFASTGPINSVIVNVVAPHMRATAVALSIFTIHLLGDVPSPSLVGVVSDARSLGEAVRIIPLAVPAAAVAWPHGAGRARPWWRDCHLPGGHVALGSQAAAVEDRRSPDRVRGGGGTRRVVADPDRAGGPVLPGETHLPERCAAVLRGAVRGRRRRARAG